MMIIVCIAIIIGAVVISVCSAFFEKNKLEELKNTGDLFAAIFSDYYRNSADETSLQRLDLSFEMKSSVRISLYDENGSRFVAVDSADNNDLSDAMRKNLDSAVYLNSSAASVSKSEPEMTFGKKFTAKDPQGEEKTFYLIACKSTADREMFTLKTAVIYIGIALAAIIACYVALKRKTRDNMNFENSFLRITGQYTKGDFSEKITTDISPSLQHISDLVNQLASHVENSEETSRAFIANVSHELRTPMTTIGGFVDGILDGTIKKSRQQEYLILVSQEIQRLRILITSMLNMSRFESGTMTPNFAKADLSDLVFRVMLMFEKRAEEKELEVEGLDGSPLMAIVDTDLMHQAVYNLVENAVKFVNKGGTLSFTFDKRDGICIIGIRNTGEGLKDSEIQQVFDRFYKTDSSRGKDKTGLGLGLSISRKIVHLHKGHIVVKSVYKEYTEFQIQIPEDPTKTDSIKKI